MGWIKSIGLCYKRTGYFLLDRIEQSSCTRRFIKFSSFFFSFSTFFHTQKKTWTPCVKKRRTPWRVKVLISLHHRFPIFYLEFFDWAKDEGERKKRNRKEKTRSGARARHTREDEDGLGFLPFIFRLLTFLFFLFLPSVGKVCPTPPPILFLKVESNSLVWDIRWVHFGQLKWPAV